MPKPKQLFMLRRYVPHYTSVMACRYTLLRSLLRLSEKVWAAQMYCICQSVQLAPWLWYLRSHFFTWQTSKLSVLAHYCPPWLGGCTNPLELPRALLILTAGVVLQSSKYEGLLDVRVNGMRDGHPWRNSRWFQKRWSWLSPCRLRIFSVRWNVDCCQFCIQFCQHHVSIDFKYIDELGNVKQRTYVRWYVSVCGAPLRVRSVRFWP